MSNRCKGREFVDQPWCSQYAVIAVQNGASMVNVLHFMYGEVISLALEAVVSS
jgi:hypothetical protein